MADQGIAPCCVSPIARIVCWRAGAFGRDQAGVVHETFPPNYWPGDDPFEHLVFALKYDDFNLDVLDQSLTKPGAGRVLAHVERQPNGRYARQLGYLYELLTGEQLALKGAIGGAYVNFLDPDKYLVATLPDKNTRWHVNDNLLGSARFCPVVGRIPACLTAPPRRRVCTRSCAPPWCRSGLSSSTLSGTATGASTAS